MPTYVVTGANRGLGLEFVRQLSASSTNTIIAGVRSLSSDLDSLKSYSQDNNLHILECNTASPESIASFAQQCTSIVGKDAKVDFVLNNAGINAIPNASPLSIPEASFHEHMSINVLGPAKLVEHLGTHLQSGSVVMNMTSGLGSLSRSQGSAKCPVYSISKAAVNMLTVQLAASLKERRVVCVCMDPGWVKTRMGGEGAVLQAEESIRKMLGVLSGLREGDSGKFYKYSGEEVPW